MDILFIHPGNQRRIYQDLANQYTAIATPSWTTLLAGGVREQDISATIYDVNVEGWDEKTPRELYEKFNPDLTVILVYGHTPSASTQTMPAALMITRDIKSYNHDIVLAMGGLHPSALPERTLRECEADYVIQGEGLYTIPALYRYLKGKTAIKNVPGLWYWDGDDVAHTAPAGVCMNLDEELPGYTWDLLPDLSRYRAHNMHCFQDFDKSQRDDFADVRSNYVALNTSLGCPYNCHYCCINALFGKPGIRYWSVERVMEWFDELHRRGVRHIRLDDELFILSPKRVEAICDRLIDRGYDFNLWVYGRVDTIRPGILKKMKLAGFNWICLGIESANEKVRNDVNKKISRDVPEVVKMIQEHGIYVLGNYIFGLPEDDMATMEETLQQAMSINCEFANFYVALPYPGSGLYDDAMRDGLRYDDWAAFSQHSYETSPLPTRYLAPREVLAFRDEAFIRYHENNCYLSLVERRFSSKVRSHIEEMLKVKIRRRLLEE